MKTLIKDKAGMTLVEMVIGMLILSIIMLSVTSVLTPTLRIYQRTTTMAEMNTLLDNLANEIIGDFMEATEVGFASAFDGAILTVKDGYTVEYQTDAAGIFTRDGIPVLPEQYFKNRTVDVLFKNGDGYDPEDDPNDLADPVDPINGVATSFVIIITINGNDIASSIQREYAVRPLCLNQ